MTLIDQLRILRIPSFAKALIAVLVVGLVALNVYVVFRGLQDSQYDFWIAAGASLMAAAAPALAVASVVVLTESGTGALKRHMQELLAWEIPEELAFTFEAAPPKLSARCRPSALRQRPNLARVQCGMYKGELWANYQLVGKWRGQQCVVRLRVELVMRRINVNLIFSRELAAAKFGLPEGAPAEALGAAFRSAFQHTLAGASGAGYTFNPLPMKRSSEDGEDIAFVATREIDPQFVWNPAARLEFIQDLMLMFRSFVTEHTEVFVSP